MTLLSMKEKKEVSDETLSSSVFHVLQSSPNVEQKDIREAEISQNWVQSLGKIVRVHFVLGRLHDGGRCGEQTKCSIQEHV